MRLRKIQGAEEAIQASPLVIGNPKEYRGHWRSLWSDDPKEEKPLELEIGMGKGEFLSTLAAANPSIHYLGIEKFSSVLFRALQRREEVDLPNLFYLLEDAQEIEEFFTPGEVSRIYLNFSDPWPKDRHARRRLTSREFLRRYANILAPEGLIYFKTDNVALFDFSLEEIEEEGWNLQYVTRDLHRSPWNEGNIITEYERKFSALGKKILGLCIQKPSKA